jgi:hypothetical protein
MDANLVQRHERERGQTQDGDQNEAERDGREYRHRGAGTGGAGNDHPGAFTRGEHCCRHGPGEDVCAQRASPSGQRNRHGGHRNTGAGILDNENQEAPWHASILITT